jgi:hypothetical protein
MRRGTRAALVVVTVAFVALLSLSWCSSWELRGLAAEVVALRARDVHHARGFRELYLMLVCENEAAPRCDARQLGTAALVNLVQLVAALVVVAIGVRPARRLAVAALAVCGVAVTWLEVWFHVTPGIDLTIVLVGAAIALFAIAQRLCRRRGLEIVTSGFGFALIAIYVACVSGPLVALSPSRRVHGSILLPVAFHIGVALFATVPIGLMVVLVTTGRDEP